MTLGDLKSFFATATVNQSLRSQNSLMGKMVHWVLSDIYGCANFWWNQDSDTFTTTSGTATYFLNNRVAMDNVWGMQDQTNDSKIIKKDLSHFYNLDPTPTDTGEPIYWAYVKQAEVSGVPAVAGVLSVVSSSSLDTSISVLVRGKVSGNDFYEVVQLNGTTAAVTTTSWDASAVLSISLESVAAGLVTCTIGASTVAQIPAGQLRVQRPMIRLFQVPGGTYTIEYHYYKRSIPLVNDAEIVDLPDEGFKALRYGIEEIAHFLNAKLQESNNASQKYQLAKQELISWSERDVAGQILKGNDNHVPFAVRLPELIDGSVLL